MPGQEKAEVLSYDGWPKGVNLTAHPSLLEPDELALAKNVVLGPRGELKQRPGMQPFSVFTDAQEYERIKAWPTELTVWPGAIQGETPFFATKEGTNGIFLIANANATRVQIGPFGSSSDPDFNYVVMNGLAYVSNTASAVEVDPDNGASTPAATALTIWNTTSDTATNFPFSRVTLVAYERVFAADAFASGIDANEHRLFFSEPLLPKTWKATNFIDVSPDDGQKIRAVRQFADQLIIFKDRSIWGISGKDFSSLSGLELYQIEGSTGSTLPRTIVEVGNTLAFMDPDRGIFLFDGSTVLNIGEPVFDYIRENWNPDYLGSIHAWYADNRYHISVPFASLSASEPTNTFVYDPSLQAWTTWERGWSDVTTTPDVTGSSVPSAKLHAVGVRAFGNGYEFDGFMEITEDALTDDGDNILSIIRTGWISPSGGFARHRIKQTAIDMARYQGDVTVGMYNEYSLTAPTAFFTLSNPGGATDGQIWRSHAFNGSRWRSVSIVVQPLADPSITDPFQLNSIRLLVSTLSQTRGANTVES